MKKYLLATCLLALPLAAFAGDRVYPVANPAYKAECSSCHLAYPPQLLPAESWKALMAGLSRHFGADASIDAGGLAQIGLYLEQNAGGRMQVAAGSAPRISETSWFVKEHRKVPAATWKGAAVKSAANCAACHTQAESGNYSERTLRVPR